MKLKILFLIAVLLMAPLAFAFSDVGSNYETVCEGETCTTTVYSYQKYYQENGNWLEVDEGFGTSNCEEGFEYCVDNNLYQVHIPEKYGSPLVTYEDSQISFAMLDLFGLDANESDVVVEENIVTYKNISPGIDVKYTYLPHKVKEEIVIYDKGAFSEETADIEIAFSLDSYGDSLSAGQNKIQSGDLLIEDFIAYDSANSQVPISFELVGDNMVLTVPLEWLNNESRIYPVYIDPTIGLNDTAIAYNGYVEYRPSLEYDRADNPIRNLLVGTKKGGFIPPDQFDTTNSIYRGVIEWNISSLPADSVVTAINLSIHVSSLGTSGNQNLSLWSLEKAHYEYDDNNSYSPCLGNCNFWKDMGNNTSFLALKTLSTGKNVIPLSINASIDFNDALSGRNWWAIGFKGYEGTPVDWQNETEIASKDNANVSTRPSITLTYQIVNESAADNAIQQGILSVIPNATIHDGQQVYVRYANGEQKIGRFDKFVVYGNKRWGLNYVTSGENFTGMTNVSNTFYVLELDNLATAQIRQAVMNFINGTVGL